MFHSADAQAASRHLKRSQMGSIVPIYEDGINKSIDPIWKVYNSREVIVTIPSGVEFTSNLRIASLF